MASQKSHKKPCKCYTYYFIVISAWAYNDTCELISGVVPSYMQLLNVIVNKGKCV